jgi:tRNA nucleotidyltransferase (CCA-adding enzyme)
MHKGTPLTEPGVRRLVKDLAPDNDIYIWQLLRMADGGGRGLGYRPFSAKLQAVTLYEEMQSRGEQFKPLLMGKHLIELGYLPGPSMGVILKAAEQAQIEGMFSDLVGAKSWVSENVMSPVTSSSKEF